MKKLTTLLTTTLIAVALMMTAPAAMADPGKGNAKLAAEFCHYMVAWGVYATHGECMKDFRADKK